jgi:hypothetical protein
MASSGGRASGWAGAAESLDGVGRWAAIVPGLPQWRRGQRSRGAVLFGSYLSALAVGAFGWGSGLGSVLLGFAFFAHCASVADAIRQSAFPGFGPWAPWFSAAFGLGAAGYVPALAIALNVACPVRGPEGGYLVDRSAYLQRAPEPGHRVWLVGGDGRHEPCLVAVVATGGQEVSWSRSGMLVDGRRPAVGPVSVSDWSRSRGTFRVSERSMLVVCIEPDCPRIVRAAGDPGTDLKSLELVPDDRVLGRAWARSYPIFRRGFFG